MTVASHNTEVVVIGPSFAGKSHLIYSLVKKSTASSVPLKPTVSPQVVSGLVDNVQFFFVDTGGNSFSQTISRSQTENANFLIFVFDASSGESFRSVKALHSELPKREGGLLVGTKSDLNAEIGGPAEEEVAAFAKTNNLKLFKVNQHSTTELSAFLVAEVTRKYAAFIHKATTN